MEESKDAELQKIDGDLKPTGSVEQVSFRGNDVEPGPGALMGAIALDESELSDSDSFDSGLFDENIDPQALTL